MELSLYDGKPPESDSDAVVYFDFHGSRPCLGAVKKVAKEQKAVLHAYSIGGFRGKEATTATIFRESGPAIVLAGLGDKKEYNLNVLRNAVAAVIQKLRKTDSESVVLVMDLFGEESAQEKIIAMAEAALISNHRFDILKTKSEKPNLKKISICVTKKTKAAQKALNYAHIVATETGNAQDLANSPAVSVTPEYISKYAKEELRGLAKVTVFDERELNKMNAGGILAVGAGSPHPPRMLIIEYGKRGKPIVLVGKGVTFDSGGLSLKPAQYMETMKHDMSGAAAVLFTIKAAARLKLKKHIFGIVPLAENVISGSSYKPGDILVMMNGMTVEVLNTDAEGRLLMADALSYVSRLKPAKVIDIATLTGTIWYALGEEVSGISGTNKALVSALIKSGKATYERLWELPLVPEYAKLIEGDFADLKNLQSNSPFGGGAITAALFLMNFIDCNEWAHIDIGGTAWATKDRGMYTKGSTGIGVRLLTHYLVHT